MRARTVLPATVAVAAMLLVGCTEPTDDSSGPTTSPTSTPSPSPTPTPTDGIQVHSDPATGLMFDDVPALTGDEADVYNQVALYQKAYWETARTNEVSPIFATIASAEIQDTMARIAAANAAEDARIGGEFHTWISDIVVTGDTATAVKCNDFRQATFANNTGELTAHEAGQDVPKRNKVELLRLDGGVWYVNKLMDDGTC